MKITFTLNGDRVTADVNPLKKLSDLLHDDYGLDSVHTSCRSGRCGMCTVIMEDEAYPSCLIPAFAVQDKSVLTLEGLREMRDFEDLTKAFERTGYQPCEYCFPSKALLIYALLLENLHPGETEIMELMEASACTCNVVNPLVRSIQIAAAYRRDSSYGR